MGNKHFFAFLGVTALLVANLAGYYFLWPIDGARPAKGAAFATEEKGETRLVAAKLEKKTVIPQPVIEKPAAPKIDAINEDEAVHKLIEHIRRDNEEMKAPRPLPSLQSDPLTGSLLPPANPDAVSLTKSTPSLWLTNVERSADRTVVTAKLRHPDSDRIAAEFVVQCDRVESVTSPTESLIAHGRIAFFGPGVTGNCGRLTISLQEARIVFEEAVQFRTITTSPETAAGMLIGDRVTWEPGRQAPIPLRPVSLPSPN